MIEIPSDWALGGLFILLLPVLLLAWGVGQLTRLRAEFAELRAAQEQESRRASADLRELERSLARELGALRELQADRLGELTERLARDGGALRVGLVQRFDGLERAVRDSLGRGQLIQLEKLNGLQRSLEEALNRHRAALDERQLEAMRAQQELLQGGMAEVRRAVADALSQHAQRLGERVDGLTRATDERLREIGGQVERRLGEGFQKTTETFAQVLEHLGRIDEAQKRITELSSNVVSLQEILADKRSRGAFGEVQLAALVRNVLPESGYALQHGLSNQGRVDCMLFLPAPTGNVPIDAKFPLEGYRRMTDTTLPELERAAARRQFRTDIRRHIGDIASKYIIAGETADGAVMFIPAEAVFAEIHAHFPELVEEAYRRRVWLVSPTTLMAILTTARAVMKDAATREQVHVIQRHLGALAKDFDRFQQRMDRLARHIEQARDDVGQVHVSAKRISGRFHQIERVELEPEPAGTLPVFRRDDEAPPAAVDTDASEGCRGD